MNSTESMNQKTNESPHKDSDKSGSMIQVQSLRKEFDTPEGTIVAVDDIDFEVEKGEFMTLVGPSGCGKTTTLRCLAGLEFPSSGTISFDDVEVTDDPPNKRGVAMMFQNIALYPHMTVIDNIAYPMKVNNVSKDERYERAEEAAEIMQIPELLDKYPGELSGGQRQRAALARTIIQDPVAFLMDEPLSDLDANLKVDIRKEIQQVHKRTQQATVYVTHDQEEALTMSDKIAVMNNGIIEQIGSPDDLYQRPRNRFVANFIGNPNINFFEGSIVDLSPGSATVDIDGKTFTFDIEHIQDPTGEQVTVGARPETLHIGESDETSIDGEVTLVERIGDRSLARVDGPEGEIRITIPANSPVKEENNVGISFDTTKMYLFDGETEELVARGTQT